MNEEKTTFKQKFGRFHDKHYKHLLLIPIAIFLACFAYMFVFYGQHHDFVSKDISLTGGTSITLYGNFDSAKLKADLSSKLDEVNIREISDLLTRQKIAVIIETKTNGDNSKKILESYLGYSLNEKNSSFEFTGPSLSQSFYEQLLVAILMAFVFMGITVFVIFRKTIPAAAVIISAFADIFMTLSVINLMGVKMSSAGIVAFLMLIGYSVDTDILLTNRVLRRHEGALNERILKSFETGMTMTLTAMFVVAISLAVSNSFSAVLSQIFLVLFIGLFFDMFNTWVTNVSLIKWYAKKHEN